MQTPSSKGQTRKGESRPRFRLFLFKDAVLFLILIVVMIE
jgi:hypothetical protein